jgi:hypothetical protein
MQLNLQGLREQLLAQCKMRQELLDEKEQLQSEIKCLKDRYESKFLGRP